MSGNDTGQATATSLSIDGEVRVAWYQHIAEMIGQEMHRAIEWDQDAPGYDGLVYEQAMFRRFIAGLENGDRVRLTIEKVGG